VVHDSARLTGPAVIGGQCWIDEGVVISGPVVLGEGCHIGAGATLEEVVVWPGVSVEVGARLKGCVICPSQAGNLVVSCVTP
jgi:mannose-1-phosphate guanylyltransferase